MQSSMVTCFLQGRATCTPLQLVDALYDHQYSSPTYRSEFDKELFLPDSSAAARYARPSLSSWAVVKVAAESRRQIGRPTETKQGDPYQTVPLIDAADIFSLRIRHLSQHFKTRAKLPWFLLESMAAPFKNSLPIVRKRRPHPQIITAAISSFILSRIRYANGYMAVAFGIWLFSCHSHIDAKRILCRIRMSISDSAVRDALYSMARSGKESMQERIRVAAADGQAAVCLILDN
ncbi:hypothetical protein C8J56DRAFT_832711, partial [Mycena floridula]